MATIGATLAEVEPGRVVIELHGAQALTSKPGPARRQWSPRRSIRCGYSAFSLMPLRRRGIDDRIKINLLAPAQGERFRMVGEVIKTGPHRHGGRRPGLFGPARR